MERKNFDPRNWGRKEAIAFGVSAITTAALIASQCEGKPADSSSMDFKSLTKPGVAMSVPRGVFPVQELPKLPIGNPFYSRITQRDIDTMIEEARSEGRINPVETFKWPIGGRITRYFGPEHPLGIDIEVPFMAIGASQRGFVTFAGGDRCCSYGLYIDLEHAGGYSSRYAHLSEIKVDLGQKVSQGEEIGISGNTGFSNGPHLHFEIRRNGQVVNPLSFLP